MNRIAYFRWLLSLLCIAPCAQAAAPDPALARLLARRQRRAAHRRRPKARTRSRRCTLQFKEEQLESTCRTSRGLATTTYPIPDRAPPGVCHHLGGQHGEDKMASATREYAYRIERAATHRDRARSATTRVLAATPRTETDTTRWPAPERRVRAVAVQMTGNRGGKQNRIALFLIAASA